MRRHDAHDRRGRGMNAEDTADGSLQTIADRRNRAAQPVEASSGAARLATRLVRLT
jgi:hypothetical protein